MKRGIFFDFLRTSLLRSKELFFLSRISKNVSLWLFAKKETYQKKVDFLTKTMNYPLCKMSIFLEFFRSFVLWSKKHSFLSRISKNISLWLFFAQKKHMRKRSMFWQKPLTNPFAKCRYSLTLLELHFSGLKSILFYQEYQKMFLSGFFCSNKTYVKRWIFWQKPWTNPFA